MLKSTLFCFVLCFSACLCDLQEVTEWILAETQREDLVPDFAIGYRCAIPAAGIEFTGGLFGYTDEIFAENPENVDIWSTINPHGKSPFFPQPLLKLFVFSRDEDKFFNPMQLFGKDVLMAFRRSHNGVIRDITISLIEEEGDHTCSILTDFVFIPRQYHEIIDVEDIMPDDLTAKDLQTIEDEYIPAL